MNEPSEKLRHAKNVAIATGIMLVPILAFAGTAAHTIVRLMFGAAFLPAVAAFLWLIPGLFAMGIEITIVQFLNSMGYPQIVVWIWFGATLLNIGLNFWAIPRFGISGASMVSSISYSLVCFPILLITRRNTYGRGQV